MAHHQHNGGQHSFSSTQTHSVPSNMAAINEDDMVADADEPPDNHLPQTFNKSRPSQGLRRESLLTMALHTDSEVSHDESTQPPHHQRFSRFDRLPSRSSTASTWSIRSEGTSDDGVTSPGTRASTPSSPSARFGGFFKRSSFSLFQKSPEQLSHQSKPTPQTEQTFEQKSNQAGHNSNRSSSDASEPTVEAELGRKRCITFACGKKSDKPVETAAADPEVKPSPPQETVRPDPPKRVCSLKFACPTKAFDKKLDENQRPARRQLSPAPPPAAKSPSPSPAPRRHHRDSDTTIKNESPKNVRKSSFLPRGRALTKDPEEIPVSDATRFHEFASSEDEPEDWMQETTVHKSRLTVGDTLKKENDIRLLGEEAEQEEDEDNADDLDDNEDDDDDIISDDELSDGGFQTDDEDGFAESDDDDDDDEDYAWWAPRRTGSPEVGTMLPGSGSRLSLSREGSETSLASDSAVSPSHSPFRKPRSRKTKNSLSVPIPQAPELPDSTDFVCGTLDEDRPLEAEYLSCMEQRKALKHRPTPQDIDPTFPTDDPDMDSDEDEVKRNGETPHPHALNEDEHFGFGDGQFEDFHGEDDRGRSMTVGNKVSSQRSPKCHRSPAPIKSKPTARSPPPKHKPTARSPPPKPLFGAHSPKRMKSPAPVNRMTSPPPSRRASAATSPTLRPMTLGTAFLGHRPLLTHTSSLPRSPNPFGRSRQPSLSTENLEEMNDEDEELKESSANDKPYARGAIDIVQGLERKRLRRRQKFYEKYCKKEERKLQRGEEPKRPVPGKGAQRMKQIGIECAIYRGKRVLSI